MLLPLVDEDEKFDTACDNVFLIKVKNKEQIKKDLRNMLKAKDSTAPGLLSEFYEFLNTSFRNVIVQFIKQNQQKYSSYVDESFDGYLAKAGEKDFFGGELEIKAFCDKLNLRVKVYSEDEQGRCLPVSEYGSDNIPAIRILHTQSSSELRLNDRNHYHLLIEPEYVPAHLAVNNNSSSNNFNDIQLQLLQSIIEHTDPKTFEELYNLLSPFADGGTEPEINNDESLTGSQAGPRFG
jgi:OTU-like cysteine protease